MTWTSRKRLPSIAEWVCSGMAFLSLLTCAPKLLADQWVVQCSALQAIAVPPAEPPDDHLFKFRMGAIQTSPDSYSYRAWITDTQSDGPPPDAPPDSCPASPSRVYDPHDAPLAFGGVAVRTGWWVVDHRGALTKVGEYQGLKSSPFWDIDLLESDGRRTLDFYGTGLDNETTQTGLYLFTPALTTDFRYQRFLHRLDHDPLNNIPPPESGAEIIKEDLNVGEDYAIRVQDIRLDVKGKLTAETKYYFDIWFRRKKGERQALGTHHGAPADRIFCRNCHIESQRQEIDWATTRLEPGIETRLGSITAEYSRPIRIFTQNDEVVTRSYGHVHPYDNYTPDGQYALVPENVSQTDRLKLSTDLPWDSHIFSQLYRGDTRNLDRDTRRDFYGFDVRLSNDYFSRTTLNGFVRYNRQLNQFPPFLVPPEEIATHVATAVIPPYDLRHPVDYLRTSTGVDANLRPFRTTFFANRLTVNVGTELGVIKRSYAERQIQNTPDFLDQHRTAFVNYFASTSMRWHPRFDTRLRYDHRNTSNPLYGVDDNTGLTNSSLPTCEDVVSLDATWLATDKLMAMANVAIQNRQNHSDTANFTEDDYPMMFAMWYAPFPAWSVTAGYGYFTNWIEQDIYFPSDTPNVETYDRQPWNYGGRGQVLNFGSNYAWTDRLTLTGSVQFVWALDSFSPLALWPDLPAYSEVLVNTRRYTCGLDWSSSAWTSAYLRYIFEDYDDGSAPYNSGSAHMVLAGLTTVR